MRRTKLARMRAVFLIEILGLFRTAGSGKPDLHLTHKYTSTPLTPLSAAYAPLIDILQR